MYFYELKITLNLKRNIHCNEITEKLSIMFNKCMLYDKYLKSIHEINMYKLYTFEGLSPFEKDKIYKKDRFYMTRLRCIDKSITYAFRECLKKTKTNEFEVLAVDIDTVEPKKISLLFNVTPAVCCVENEPWTDRMNIDIVCKSINENILKKIKMIEGIDKNLEHNMIQSIKLKNRIPIGCKYKKITLLGNKFEIEIKDDEFSQYMAQIALATGLLEKNSLGYGYCLYKTTK